METSVFFGPRFWLLISGVAGMCDDDSGGRLVIEEEENDANSLSSGGENVAADATAADAPKTTSAPSKVDHKRWARQILGVFRSWGVKNCIL